MIRLSNVSKSFDNGKSFVVNDVSFDVYDGETLVLLGASGCGKTTTLKMINRLIEPTSGVIEVDHQNVLSQDVIQLRRSMGYVFQRTGLFPHMTVEQNINLVFQINGREVKNYRERISQFLEAVNLDPSIYLDRYPKELSGGQQQRVAVARGLAVSPKYLLMDEPFGALDAINRKSMQNELKQIRDKFNITVIFVTHDILEAIQLGDRVAVMNAGKIEQIGSAQELIENPKTEFVRKLFSTVEHAVAQYQEEVQ